MKIDYPEEYNFKLLNYCQKYLVLNQIKNKKKDI